MITVSFHNGNVSGDLVRAQKAVFDHFGYTDHLQIHTNLSHGEAIDEWLNTRHWDEVAIFDIDCIPLNNNWHHHAHILLANGYLYGVAQKANHIPGSEIYIGPAFVCFDRIWYETHDKPSFVADSKGDVGYRLTQASGPGSKRMLWPIHAEEPKWDLDGVLSFGLGTTYALAGEIEGIIYHAFESRFQHGSTSRFIEKCKEVINGNSI